MNRSDRIRGRVIFSTVLLMIVTVFAFSPMARAGSFGLTTGFGYTGTDRESENLITGETSEASTTALSQTYNLYFSRDIYPYLIFAGGGNFRIDDTESRVEGTATAVERTSIRPYLELKVENPFVQAGVGYQDFEDRQEVSGASRTARFSKTGYSFLSVRPDQLPELDLRLTRTERSSDPETTDMVEDQATLQSRYRFDGGNIEYALTQNSNTDRLNDFQVTYRSHNLKVRHGRSYLDGRVSVSTGYWFTHSETDLQGTGSAQVPVLRSAGLYLLDLTPEDGPALESIGGLIDGDTASPTSLDIGLSGDETTLTNIGLDLGFTATVDTVHLWVDRDLTQEVSESFTWYVYTSPDNTDTSEWQLQAAVSPGNFGPFESRFEIAFPPVETRFIKVAVAPLLPSVPGASGFPSIFVTEMEVFTTLTSQDEFTSMSHRLDYSVAWRVSDRTSVGYDWLYRNRESGPADIEESSMVNGVFVNHTFGDVFSGSARISRQNREETAGNRASNTYSASLRGDYMKTFSQTLTMSGSRNFETEGDSQSDSVFLRNNADLFPGVSAYLDTGISRNKAQGEDETRGTIWRVGSRLVPNEMVTVNLDYRANRWQVPGEKTSLKETGSFQTFILPSQYLSMFARLGFDEDEDARRTTQHYSLSWSPSSGGSVQFLLSYDQRILSEGNEEETVLSPGIRWRITSYATLRTTYSWSTSESDTELVDSRSLSANLNMNL